jgi:predicted small secreted protein
MKGHRAMLGAFAVLALSLGSACRNTAEGVKEDTRENAAKAEQEAQEAKDASKDTAEKVGDKVEAAGDKIAEGAKDVGQAVKEGAKEVAAEVDAKKQTLDVKTALMADKSIDASGIDVDTDDETKTVYLKGSVPSAAQRTAATKVAQDHAAGYRIRNELTIPGERRPRPPS